MPMKVANRKKKPGVLGTTTNGSGGNFTDSAMDEFLGKRGLYRKPIAKDGSCLFRAVSEQVHNCQARHLDVRKKCIAFMRQNRGLFEEFVEGPFDHHLFKLQNPKEWAGQVEITALSQMYRKDFVVYQDINSPPTKVTDHGYKDKILLCYSNGNHYDIIYHNHFQENAAMCQSLLYEMLYNKVFIELDKKENTKKGKQKGLNSIDNSRSSDKNIMEWVNGCMTDDADVVENSGDDDGWTEVKSKARVKHERLAKPVEVDENKDPEEIKAKVNSDQKYLWEVRRSVDPHLYRNISLEVWEEEKHLRQQQDLTVAVTLQYKNGDRCLVKLCPPNAPVDKNYTAIIKEDYTGSGTVSVYIPELKEKQTVPIQFVKPSENQQGNNYKELSGYYKKEEAANGPVSEDGSKDESKIKKKRPPRSRRGPGKEDVSRGRGRQRERYSNRRRFPKEDRIAKDEEEAKFIAEQIKLVELQEKDPKAFPALPVRSTTQSSPSSPAADLPPLADLEEKVKVPTPTLQKEEKAQEKETAPTSVESTAAEFWSRLIKTKQSSEAANTPHSPTTLSINRKPDNQPQKSLDAVTHKVEERIDKQEKQEFTDENVCAPVQEKVTLIENDVECIRVKENNTSEIVNRQYQTAQLKPLSSDVKHSKTSGQVFEVKISQPAKLIQQVRVSPSLTLQQPKYSQQSSELEEVETPSSLVDFSDVLEQELTEQVTEKKLIESEKEMIDSSLKEQQEHIEEELPETSPSTVDLPNKGDVFSGMEECSVSEEDESAKLDKAKVVDVSVSSASPERKMVTFAETHKEIPVAQYGQKGILIVNGTNRSSVEEQGYKSFNTEEYASSSKDSKQDFKILPQEQTEKDLQSFPVANVNEGLHSSSPTAQQQNQALMQFMMPGVQIPNGPSVDPSGADLPQDPQTLRYFFNLGYHQYLTMVNQMNNQQLPYVYMYQGSMPDQMLQQSAQPVATLPQQQMYMQHQQVAYQHAGLQNYQPTFHVPQTNPDSTSQHERTSERTNPAPHQHQAPLQPQQQMPILHKQQAGHFQSQQPQQQSQFNQSWRPRMHYSNSNKPHLNHHGNISQQRFQYHQNSAGNPRQIHYKDNNKQNRKQQGPKTRNNESMPSPHFNHIPHPLGQNIAHNQATPSQPTTFYIPPDQSKGSGHEFYPGNNVMYNTVNYHSRPPSGIPSHNAVPSRGLYN